jgi:hypothetical protein
MTEAGIVDSSHVRSTAIPGAAFRISARGNPEPGRVIGQPMSRWGITGARPSTGARWRTSLSSARRLCDKTPASHSAEGKSGFQTRPFTNKNSKRPSRRNDAPSHAAAVPGLTKVSCHLKLGGKAASTFSGPAPRGRGPKHKSDPRVETQYRLRRKTARTVHETSDARAALARLPKRTTEKASAAAERRPATDRAANAERWVNGARNVRPVASPKTGGSSPERLVIARGRPASTS